MSQREQTVLEYMQLITFHICVLLSALQKSREKSIDESLTEEAQATMSQMKSK